MTFESAVGVLEHDEAVRGGPGKSLVSPCKNGVYEEKITSHIAPYS